MTDPIARIAGLTVTQANNVRALAAELAAEALHGDARGVAHIFQTFMHGCAGVTSGGNLLVLRYRDQEAHSRAQAALALLAPWLSIGPLLNLDGFRRAVKTAEMVSGGVDSEPLDRERVLQLLSGVQRPWVAYPNSVLAKDAAGNLSTIFLGAGAQGVACELVVSLVNHADGLLGARP